MSPSDKRKMKKFVAALMKKMTLDEKIGQLNLVTGGATVTGAVVNSGIEKNIRGGKIGGMFGAGSLESIIALQKSAVEKSRLGIPLIFGSDVIHGHKTVFPIPLGLSCTWDMELIKKSARIAALEASADGLKWVFSPMVDISRDPRWGRVAEGAGEDPFLGSRIAEAMVRGYQGDDLAALDTVLACVKHFALYGAAEGGRDYNTVDMSPQKMHETYLPPFLAAIRAGCGSLMTSFNDVNGVPATAHEGLLRDLLRKAWGFDGLIVSDYTGINEMSAHGLGDLKTVSALALKAGIDMDMVGEGFLTTLKQSLKEGKIKKAHIEASCRRVLEAKYQLGLFADPFRYLDPERRAQNTLTPEHRKAARAMAADSCVLLKNANNVLPLEKSGTVALIGPLADDKINLLGTWAVAGNAKDVVSVREAMEKSGAKILYARGADITDDPALAEKLNCHETTVVIDPRSPEDMIAEAVATARRSDVVVAVVGEAKEHSGEASSRSEIGLPENQKKLVKALLETGKPVVLVTMSGRPLTLEWEDKNIPVILQSWFGGVEAGNGIADILFGDRNPSGKLTATFPRNVGQIPVYYNHKNTGRTYTGDFKKFTSCYLDVSNEPLYPFGHGLSYTAFDYSPVNVSKTKLRGEETLTAAVTLKNTGKHAGHEIVQLYITDPVASMTRPVKELKGFQKIFLKPGESKEVSFKIQPEDLKFFNTGLRHDWESGDFIIHIGGSSADVKSATVHWDKAPPEKPSPKSFRPKR